jgi:hypothetical protein
MLRACALLAAFFLGFGSAPAAAGERPVVVELFTSEGCSSCPPADALLAELAGRLDVLALSFHVDYWDRLGWKDPFSSPAATARQQRYASLLGLATVYTPQFVVDGKWQAVGSDRAGVERAFATAHREHSQVPVVLDLSRGVARIQVGPAQGSASAAVLLIGFDRWHISPVARGENAGRKLAHVDVVRGVVEVGKFGGKADTIEAPIPWQSERVAVLVQAADGAILGAAAGDSNSL